MKKKVAAFQRHPWHGVPLGENAPDICTAYIEIVPGDTVKYEIDKPSGIIKVDRPQAFSNVTPALYGFFPRTYCAEEVGEFCSQKTNIAGIYGDGDPLDVCVITEKIIPRNNILVQVIPIGGFRMIDKNEADDKIIAVLKGDPVYEQWKDIQELPISIVQRLQHYFLTYKKNPNNEDNCVKIAAIYGKEEAAAVIRCSVIDYHNHYEVDES